MGHQPLNVWNKATGTTGQCLEEILNRETVLKICDPGIEGMKIIDSTGFSSQQAFNKRRGLRASNILIDQFTLDCFKGKRILEFGPGHYSFALLARHLGADVVCVERDPAFVALGRYLEFDIQECDFSEIRAHAPPNSFDGVWMKGSFNSCNHPSDNSIIDFVHMMTEPIREGGWGWVTTVNKLPKTDQGNDADVVLEHKINTQRDAFIDSGWDVSMIDDETRSQYALQYSGSPYYFTRGIEIPGNPFSGTS